MKKFVLIFFIFMSLIATSCADSARLEINGETVLVEPYGWANESSMKNDSVVYQLNPGNIVWSIILSETIIAPVILTGWALYEPVKIR